MEIKKVLEKPIAEWPLLLQNVEDLQQAEDELCAIIQRATLLKAYLSHRYNSGCGERSHADSAEAANKTLIKVRKAIGYSSPYSLTISI